jgi:DNA-binding HxlR family transcriptional regulator
MTTDTFHDMNCSVARSLAEIGERWSLLIVREAIMGSTRFDEFQARLGIARNILTSRLVSLTEAGVLVRTVTAENARIHTYTLTDKGWDLYPVIAAIMHWGDRWIAPEAGPPIVLVDRATGQSLPRVTLRRATGEPVRREDIAIKPGKGADARTRARLGRKT